MTSISMIGKAGNRLFPSFPGHLYQNEVKCSVFDMEMISFSSKLNSFSQERLCTWPHFESEGFWNSELTGLLSVCAVEEKVE